MHDVNPHSPVSAISLQARFSREIRELSRVSDLQGVWGIARQWLVIALSILAISRLHGVWWWAAYPVMITIIASRQHAFLGLMHDGTHYRILRHRALNDFISDIFCAFPVGLSTELYRRQHLLHHQYVNTDKDPYWVQMNAHEDWQWPKDHIAALRLFASDLIGLCSHKTFLVLFQWSPAQPKSERMEPISRAERIRFLVFITSVATALLVTHMWSYFFLLWVVPLFTIFGALIRARSVAEHLVLPSTHELNSTRHVKATLFERFLIAPVNLNYHLAHHLFPSVPFYNLPRLHRLLMTDESFRRNAHVSDTYIRGVFCEVTNIDPIAA